MANTVTDLPPDFPLGPFAHGCTRRIDFAIGQKGSTERYSLVDTTRLLMEIRAEWQTSADPPLLAYDTAAVPPTIVIDDATNGQFHPVRAVGDLTPATFPVGYDYRYAVQESPSTDILARGPWLVAEAGVSSS